MNRKTIFMVAGLNLATILIVLLGLQFALVRANPDVQQVGAPALVSYQGYLTYENGEPLTEKPTALTVGVYGDASGGTALWEETISSFEFNDGYFNVELPLASSIFDDSTTWLQVSANGTVFPRQQIASVPYALQAQDAAAAPWNGLRGVPVGFADGMDAGQYQNLKIVAKNCQDGGADECYLTVAAALNSITDPSATNPYLVKIGPGIYEEQIVLDDPYVFIEGSGAGVTIIQYDTAGSDVATAAVVRITDIADYGLIRNLTIKHMATSGTYAVGVYTAGRYTGLYNVYVDLQSAAANTIYGVYNTGNDAIIQGRDLDVHLPAAGTSYAWATHAGATSWLLRCALTGADYAFQTAGDSELNFRFGVANGNMDNVGSSRIVLSEINGTAIP